MRNNYLKSLRFKVCARDASVHRVLGGCVSGDPGCLGARCGVVPPGLAQVGQPNRGLWVGCFLLSF